ncbi:MAG: DMT family transporter [Candidatus Chisholmbacteria bacterium]|nr:DMT family transporter [Candidatus Chisholmbacteria bacterium]
MTNRQKALVYIVLGSIIGGSLSAANKIGIRNIPPLGFVSARVAVSALFLLPIMVKTRLWRVKNKLQLMLFSLLATANIGLFIVGLARTTASMSSILYAAVPLLTAILSHWIYQEKITSRKLVGIIIGLVGTLVIVLTPALSQNGFHTGSVSGNLIVFLAVVIYAFHTALSKKMQQRYSPFVIVEYFIITATLTLTPFALWEMTQAGNWLTTVESSSIFTLLYVVVIGTIVLYFTFQEAIRFATPLIASLQMYLVPVFGVIFASLLLGEKLSSELALGAFLVLVSIWLITGKPQPRPGKNP